MGEIGLIESVGVMIVAAAAAVLLTRRLNVPTIVLYILTGLLLGPVLGMLGDGHEAAEHGGMAEGAVGIVAELGIALLLFLVGLELSLEKIRDVGRVAVIAGIGQVVFTAVIGFVLSLLLQFSMMESMFLATALTFSSTVVVVKLLDQKNELTSLYGRIAVGIFLVQDVVVIVALTFLAGLDQQAGTAAEGFAWGQMMWSLLRAFAGMAVLLTVAMLASAYLLAGAFRWAARSAETLLIWSLFWCFAFVVTAELMALSPEIGAFLAGVSLAQLRGAEDLRRRVHPLMNFFIAIFFVALGANMEIGVSREHWLAAAVLSLFVLLGNPLIFMWIIARCGYSERTSFLTSVTVAQISEFSFIFATMGVMAGLIGQEILSIVTIVGLVTIAASAYMIYYNHGLYELARRFGLLKVFRASAIEEEAAVVPIRDHIIIVGMNALGRELAKMLHERGETVLAIDNDVRKLQGLSCRTMVGNIEFPSLLEEAGLERAKFGISALQIEETNNLFAFQCKRHGVPVAVHAFDRSVFDDLRHIGVDYLIDSKSQGGTAVATRLYEQGIVEA